MSKAVLISIKPQWCELIANGQKTVEVRKGRPKLETPFKCYIYCTSVKNMPLSEYVEIHRRTSGKIDDWHEKVMGEFVCDYISEFVCNGGGFLIKDDIPTTINATKQSCLTDTEFRNYAKESNVYGWHISDLKIYDEPKELTEFNHTNEYIVNQRKSLVHWEYGIDDECAKPIRNPPQSWCYVEEVRE